MKKPNLLLVIASLTALVACKKQTSSPVSSNQLVGKWSHLEADLTPYSNGKYGKVGITKLNDPNDYVQFNSDGTGIISSSASQQTSIKYSLNGNILTVTAGTVSEVDTVKQLTSNSLWIRTQSPVLPSDPSYKYLYDSYYSK